MSTPTDTPQVPLEVEAGTEDFVSVAFQRGLWLCATVLSTNKGLFSITSIMIGVHSVKMDVETMILAGVVGLVGGAVGTAMEQFVSVYSKYEIELAQLKRQSEAEGWSTELLEDKKRKLRSPFEAAATSGMAFAVGAAIPLLAAAFTRNYAVWFSVVLPAAITVPLVGFACLAAVLRRSMPMMSALRVLIGGWVAMGATQGLAKLIGSMVL